MEKLKFGWVGVLCVLLFGGIARAQVSTGTISGSVKDSSGAVLPGAKVVILNDDTGISRTVDADENGHYSALSLSPWQLPGDGHARRVPDGSSDWNCADRGTRRSCGCVAHHRVRGAERHRNWSSSSSRIDHSQSRCSGGRPNDPRTPVERQKLGPTRVDTAGRHAHTNHRASHRKRV